jgi:hypothetical protein
LERYTPSVDVFNIVTKVSNAKGSCKWWIDFGTMYWCKLNSGASYPWKCPWAKHNVGDYEEKRCAA